MPAGLVATLGSALSSALPSLIGTGIAALAKNAFSNSQAKPPPPSTALSPQVQSLYSQLAGNLASQLNQAQSGPSPLVQRAFDQANERGLDTLERRFNARGLLRSGLLADAEKDFLSNQSGALAQANLAQRQNAFSNALNSLQRLSVPGQLRFADAAQAAQRQNAGLNSFAPLFDTALTALGGGIDKFFDQRGHFENPNQQGVSQYGVQRLRERRSSQPFGSRPGF